jgi:hypothetical protein
LGRRDFFWQRGKNGVERGKLMGMRDFLAKWEEEVGEGGNETRKREKRLERGREKSWRGKK